MLYQKYSLAGFTPHPNIRENFGVKNSDFAVTVTENVKNTESIDETKASDSNDDALSKNKLHQALSKSISDHKESPAFGALVKSEVSSSTSDKFNQGKQQSDYFNSADGQQQSSFDGTVVTGEQQPQVFDSSFSAGQDQLNSDYPYAEEQPQSDYPSSLAVAEQQPDYSPFVVIEQRPEASFGAAANEETFIGSVSNLGATNQGPYNVVLDDDDDDDGCFYLRTALPFAGYRPTRYTSLNLAQVNFQNVRNSGHNEYLTVRDDSGETEVYGLVGVAPSSAVQGGAATTYSANMGSTVPVYRELDDDNDGFFGYVAAQPNFYSAISGSNRPVNIRAEATLANNRVVLLLDD